MKNLVNKVLSNSYFYISEKTLLSQIEIEKNFEIFNKKLSNLKKNSIYNLSPEKRINYYIKMKKEKEIQNHQQQILPKI